MRIILLHYLEAYVSALSDFNAAAYTPDASAWHASEASDVIGWQRMKEPGMLQAVLRC